MSGFMDKMSGFFFKEEEGIEDEVQEERAPIAMPNERNIWKEQPDIKKNTKKPNITSIPTSKDQNMEMILIKATSYENMQEIARHIKEKKVAVVNFEEMDKATAQRMVDFLSGAAFALGGVPRKVSGGTFIFSSANVDLSGQIMESDSYLEETTSDSRYSSYQWMNKK